MLPIVSNYTYLGVDFSYNGAWDTHIKKLIKKGKQKVNQLNSIISNRYINLSARRMLLLSVLRPSLEYGSEVWEGNNSQAASLESIMLGGAKRVLGCSSKTSNEAIWGDMGLEFLQGRRDKHKLSWWYKVVNMPLSRYPKQLFQEEWNIKPRPGRQRKVWKRVVDDIFESLELGKGEWVESISKGETSIKEFLALVDESIKESDRCQFLKGLNNKTKLTIYKTFGGEVKFKRYLNGWVMQELVYSLNYVLERMDLMRSWVDIEVEKVSICVICAVRTVKVWVTFCGIAPFIQSAVHYF